MLKILCQFWLFDFVTYFGATSSATVFRFLRLYITFGPVISMEQQF